MKTRNTTEAQTRTLDELLADGWLLGFYRPFQPDGRVRICKKIAGEFRSLWVDRRGLLWDA